MDNATKNFDCQGSATSQLARRCADRLKKGIRGLFKWGGSVKALIYDAFPYEAMLNVFWYLSFYGL